MHASEQALQAVARGDYRTASQHWRSAVRENPTRADFFLGIGDAESALSRARSAAEAYETALSIAPRIGQAYLTGKSFNTILGF